MLQIRLERLLTKIFMKKLTKNVANKKGKRDKNGNLVLKESEITTVMSAIIFILMLAVLIFIVVESDNSQFRIMAISVGAVFVLAFVLLFIYLGVSGKVITEDSIINKGLIFKKTIKFDSLETIECKNNGNNVRVILRGNKKKIIIPAALTGFNEFLDILEDKVGEEKCKAVRLEINSYMK